MYSTEFKSTEQLADEKVNKHLASHLRRKLATGYSPDSTFVRILSLLSDAELIRQHEAFHADERDHAALMGMVREKNAAAKKPSAFERFSKAALARA